MNKKRAPRKKKIGLPPGTIIYTGNNKSDSIHLEIIDYGLEHFFQQDGTNVKEILEHEKQESVTWINVNGIDKIEEIKELGAHYKLHNLLIEDIVNVSQRPKLDEYDNYLFVVSRMLHIDNKSIKSEQISYVLGDNFLLTFQEFEGDVFNPVRERIKNNKGVIRKMGVDFLLFALLDIIIDNYALVIEELSDQSELIEDKLIADVTNDDIQSEIYTLKRQILKTRKSIYPLREVIGDLSKQENYISKKTKIYISDIYDHVLQAVENIDMCREIVWGLTDLHMNSLSHKMNQIMKVLTIIATIFIPLTFIAGIYGMNFKYMPELEWEYSYPILIAAMVIIFLGMLIFFKRKKWL